MKIRLMILDGSEDYIDRLSLALISKYDNIEVHAFTKPESAMEAISREHIHVLLVNEKFAFDRTLIPAGCGFAYLAEASDVISIRECRAVSKYQNVELIYKEILDIYSEQAAGTALKSDSGHITRLYSFVSAAGGTGCSTVAAAFALYAASLDKKVLYLNMELVSSTEFFFSGDGRHCISDVIYALKAGRANLRLKLESMAKRDRRGVFFYDKQRFVQDMQELEFKDVEALIRELSLAGTYDYIVADIGTHISECTEFILKKSDEILVISDASDVSNMKLVSFYDYIKILSDYDSGDLSDKLILIYNKSKNYIPDTKDKLNIRCIGEIPPFDTTVDVVGCIPANIFKNLL
ncbi:MAG: AAA family ATPase [Lachnospiraceae bacterium]|nr:AAA family ATPase [Lachnospiraceae bacterium]